MGADADPVDIVLKLSDDSMSLPEMRIVDDGPVARKMP